MLHQWRRYAVVSLLLTGVLGLGSGCSTSPTLAPGPNQPPPAVLGTMTALAETEPPPAERTRQANAVREQVTQTAGAVAATGTAAAVLRRQEAPLEHIQMLSATDGWITGREGALLHYEGDGWRDVSDSVSAWLGQLSLIAPGEGWATAEHTLAHLHAGQWTVIPAPSPAADLTDLQMLSPDDGWAVGGTNTVRHYQAGSWTPVPVTTQNISPTSLSLATPTEGWVLGRLGRALHWHAGAWTEAAVPMGWIARVRMTSAEDGWAVGKAGLLLHYGAGQWRQVPWSDPSGAGALPDLNSLSLIAPDEGWAVGSAGIILHLHAGQWSLVSSPTQEPLADVSMVSADEGWAVGGTGRASQSASTGDSVILHYDGGVWTTYRP